MAQWNTIFCQKVLVSQSRCHHINLEISLNFFPDLPVLPKPHNSLAISQAPLHICTWKHNNSCEGVYTQHVQTHSNRVEENKGSNFKESVMVCCSNLCRDLTQGCFAIANIYGPLPSLRMTIIFNWKTQLCNYRVEQELKSRLLFRVIPLISLMDSEQIIFLSCASVSFPVQCILHAFMVSHPYLLY